MRSLVVGVGQKAEEGSCWKVRVVFDAAAEVGKVSLNKTLITGPDLLKSLDGVLMRFRNERIAIAADIEAYYHQGRVPKEDADFLRFPWFPQIYPCVAPKIQKWRPDFPSWISL